MRTFILSWLLYTTAVFAQAPSTDYYQIGISADQGAAISTFDDDASGANRCTLRDALSIVSDGILPDASPTLGCEITAVGNAPESPTYVINLPAPPYTYTLVVDRGNDLELRNHRVYINGSDPDGQIIQAAQAPDTALNRVLEMNDAIAEISNVTVRHGRCAQNVSSCGLDLAGAGIYVRTSTLTLRNVRVENNLAEDSGGGIYVNFGSLDLLEGSEVRNNTVVDASSFSGGGGIHLRSTDAAVVIDASSVTGNTVLSGPAGGIANSGSLTIRNGSNISGNTAESNGGGIGNQRAIVLIEDSTLNGNVSNVGNGGAIFTSSINAEVTVINSTIGSAEAPNRAPSQGAGRGGGIYNDFFSTVTVRNSTLSHNEAVYGGALANIAFANVLEGTVVDSNSALFRGGGLYNEGVNARLLVSDVAVTNNQTTVAFESGGGIANVDSGIATIENGSTVTGNQSLLGGGLYNIGEASVMTVDATTVAGNRANSGGGAFNGVGAELSIINGSVIGGAGVGNQADGSGGAIYASDAGSEILIDASTLSHNNALFSGGAVYAALGAEVTLRNNTMVTNNFTRTGGGGAFYVDRVDTDLVLSNVTVSNNEAADNGGALEVAHSGLDDGDHRVTITDSTISDNQARFAGGAIYSSGFGFAVGTREVTISGSEFTGNSAGTLGGVIAVETSIDQLSRITIRDTILGGTTAAAANTAEQGGAIYQAASGDNSATTELENVTLMGNRADIGGGVFQRTEFRGTVSLVASNSRFVMNSAEDGSGGGVYQFLESGTGIVTLTAMSELSGNTASGSGGGLFLDAAPGPGSSTSATSQVSLTDTMVTNNTAGTAGGGIFHTATVDPEIVSTVTLLGVELTLNSATAGGGINHVAGTLVAAGNCFDGNGQALVNESGAAQDARFSWWGMADGPSDADGLSGATGSGDGVTQNVDFTPFKRQQPVPCFEILHRDGFEAAP